MAKKLLISEYLDLCLKFKDNPTDENEKKIRDFINNIEVKEYVKIKDKVISIVSIVTSIPENYDSGAAAAMVEMGKVVYGLFKYAVNLECDLDTIALLTYGVYDELKEHGLVKFIQSKCEEDYKVLTTMLDSMLNFENIYRLVNSKNLTSSEEFGKWLEQMNQWKEGLTPELVHDLATIASLDGDSFDELKQQIAEKSLDEFKKQPKENSELEKK